ncbi:MAG TPA: hypothetical protein VIS96_07740 [Terrimicrobiaceae bacterium]
MKLQSVVGAGVIEGDGQVGAPVLGARGPKGEKHSLEERATLIATFQLLRSHIEAPYLQPQAVG